MTSPSATQDRYPYQNEPIWSRSEKTVARASFNADLKRELRETMQEAKQMANQANEPADLWDLEHYLTQRRKKHRPNVRVPVFATHELVGETLHESRLSEEDLHGLREDKLKAIRSFAKFLRRTRPDLHSECYCLGYINYGGPSDPVSISHLLPFVTPAVPGVAVDASRRSE